MTELITLPTDPMPAVSKIVSHYRGHELLPWDELAHCGYHLAGVALGFVHKHPPVVGAAAPPCPDCDKEKADLLERHLAAKGTGGLDGVPWQLILSIALDLLKKFLEQRK